MNKLSKQQARTISQLFSTNLFKKVLESPTGCNNFIFDEKVKSIGLCLGSVPRKTLLKYCYQFISKNYRYEYLYKNELLNKKLLGTHSTNTATIINEFKVDRSIADFVLLNQGMKIFEIKTDLDSTARLNKQILDYYKCTDIVYIVTGTKHLKTLLSTYSHTAVGIIHLTENNTFSIKKKARPDCMNFEMEVLFRMLRMGEYVDIATEISGINPDVSRMEIYDHCYDIVQSIPVRDLQIMVADKLIARKLRIPETVTDEATPYELKYICHSMNLRKGKYQRFIEFINEDICIR